MRERLKDPNVGPTRSDPGCSVHDPFEDAGEYHKRGRTVSRGAADVPMVDADDMVIEALLDDVLDTRLLEDSVDEALRVCCKAIDLQIDRDG